MSNNSACIWAQKGSRARRRPAWCTRRAIRSKSTRKRWKARLMPIVIGSLGISLPCASSSSRSKHRPSRWTARRKNCWERSRTRDAHGNPKGRRRGGTSTTTARSPVAKPSRMASMSLLHNQGFVNVGIDHETAEFAVESLRRWWKHCRKRLYPQAQELLITADGGGSNGVRNKLWKKALQTLATEEHPPITLPPHPPPPRNSPNTTH